MSNLFAMLLLRLLTCVMLQTMQSEGIALEFSLLVLNVTLGNVTYYIPHAILFTYESPI